MFMALLKVGAIKVFKPTPTTVAALTDASVQEVIDIRTAGTSDARALIVSRLNDVADREVERRVNLQDGNCQEVPIVLYDIEGRVQLNLKGPKLVTEQYVLVMVPWLRRTVSD